MEAFKRPGAQVAPRVQNAQFSILWNRVCTARRYQGSETCILCNNHRFKDEVEHWPYCAITKVWANNILQIDPGTWIPESTGHP